jgi:hypothetical protein
MKLIKGDMKSCPACGKKVRWRALKKKAFDTMDEAKELAIHLNEEKAKEGTFTLKDLMHGS